MSYIQNRLLPDQSPGIVGILNITPDSFYDGGEYNEVEEAVSRATAMVDCGVDAIDVGGESTRPGAKEVSNEEEISRVVPVIRGIREAELTIPISIDTSSARVARQALEAGADIVNDVTALRNDAGMGEVIAEFDVPVVLMHMQGTPRTMQDNPQYDDVIVDLIEFFRDRVEEALTNGIREEQIIMDPGIGFGKTQEHNREIFKKIDRFEKLGLPVMMGHSRKSFLEPITGKPARDRLSATLAVSSYLYECGVDFIRVHDVPEHVDAYRTLDWIHGRGES
ncbi:MAG: dihydropteroate synthase [bacterium]